MTTFFLSLLFAFSLMAQEAPVSDQPSKTPVSVQLKIKGLRNNKGHLAVAVYNSANPKAFPRQGDKAFRHVYIPLESANGEQTLVIDSLPAGDYAFALFHDEDSDQKVKTLFGIPQEGVAFSNNPTLFFGPPGFDQSKVSVLPSQNQFVIEMKYLL